MVNADVQISRGDSTRMKPTEMRRDFEMTHPDLVIVQNLVPFSKSLLHSGL